ncbi:hypothetical protein R1flu_023754 [Riccia fluitans]|uniref:Uncharacterized protein n=1 Tax=Riccia fluitans TaxID=41844 RepID=A0ABD1XSY7_9MARC
MYMRYKLLLSLNKSTAAKIFSILAEPSSSAIIFGTVADAGGKLPPPPRLILNCPPCSLITSLDLLKGVEEPAL